jgi:hypothetical protein
MNEYEEQLQNSLEKGEKPLNESMDVKAYQEIFRALKKEPGYELPPRFAERIVSRIIRDQESRNTTDYFWFGAGIFFLLMAFIATILFTGFRFDFGFLRVMSDYKGLAIFGVMFVIFLNWVDKRLLRNRHVHD